jgi:hypothetical protein
MPTVYNDILVTGSLVEGTAIGQYLASSGNFNELTVNTTGVMISGWSSLNDLSDVSGSLTGINYLGDIPSGTLLYTNDLNNFTSGVITDFALSILDDEDVDAVRSTLGLDSISSVSGVLVLGTDVAQDIILSDIDGSGTIFNNLHKNIDFVAYGSGYNGNVLFYDASAGRLGVNTQAPDALFHVVSNCALDGFKIETTTNCTTGTHLYMLHNPGSTPIDGSYNATISLAGRDSNANVINYARIRSVASSTDNNSPSGTFGELRAFIDKDASDSRVLLLSRDTSLLGTENSLEADSLYNVVIGSGNAASGSYFVVVGTDNEAPINHNGIILGSNNYGEKEFNHLFGRNIVASGSGNTVAGFDIYNSGNINYIYGSDVAYTGSYGIIMGDNIKGSGDVLVDIGQNNYSYGTNNVLLGYDLVNVSNKSVLIGNNSRYVGNSGIIVGENSATTGDNNVIIGTNIKLVSTGLFICGQNIDIRNVKDSLVLEKDIAVSNASGVVIVGRGNTVNSTNNIAGLYGYGNFSTNTVAKTNLLGGENSISNISGSVVVGSENFASGTVNNTVLIGRHNYFNGNTYNNILVGNLNNQSGYQLSTNGTITGSSYDNNNPIVNTVAVGNQNIFPATGNMMLSLGNKNKVASNGGIVAGHLNSMSGDYSILFGKSNYSVGNDNILAGNNNNLYGNSSVVLSPRQTAVYGGDNVVLGNNSFVSDGLVIGNANVLYGTHNSVFGRNNAVGDTRYNFTAPIVANLISYIEISGQTNLVQGDLLVVYLTSPVASDLASEYIFERTIQANGVTYNSGTGKTTITFSNGAIPTRVEVPSNPSNFGDAFTYATTSTATGYVIRINQGSNNYVYGDGNTIASGTGNIVFGIDNDVTVGLNNMILGRNITTVTNTNDTMYLGANDATKLILGTNVVFNSGLGSTNIHFVGADNSVYSTYDNTNKRLGVGNTAPRSALDVSGTITASALRIGLSSTPNLELVTNSDGTISTSARTMFSGVNGGFVYKMSDNVGSGIGRFDYDPSTDIYTWYGVIPETDATNSDNWIPALTIRPNYGAVFNASYSSYDDEFNLKIYGSGAELPSAPVLFDTDYGQNRITMYDVFMRSGIFEDGARITGVLALPSLPTDGTILRVNADSNLESNKLYPATIPTVTTDYKITGYKTTRWFDTERLLCLSSAEDHTTRSDAFVRSEYNTIISNNDTEGRNEYDTIFNLQGLGSNVGSGFVVLFENGQTDKRGLRIDYTQKQVGINVTPAELYEDLDNKETPESTTFVVNGTAHFDSIRVGDAAIPGRVLVADADGFLSYSGIDLGLAANTLRWPLVIDTQNNTNYLALSSSDEYGVSLSNNGVDNDLGRMLAWNGDSSSWYSTPQLRAYKGDGGGARTHNIMFGEHASNAYLQTKNMHIYSAGSFHSTEDTYFGSSQYVQYYLRGSGTGAITKALTTNWSIDNSADTEGVNNQISLPSIVTDLPNNNAVAICWHYEAIVNAIAKPTTTGPFVAGVVKVEGAFHYLPDGANGTQELHFFAPNITKYTDPELSAIGVELKDTGSRVISVSCTGVANYHIMWSATIKMNQMTLPNF